MLYIQKHPDKQTIARLRNIEDWEEVPTGYEPTTQEEADAWIAAQEQFVDVKPVPTVVTPRQIRRALIVAGLRDAVEQILSKADQSSRDDWEYATEVRRDWPLVVQMGAALGKTSEEIDEIFRIAETF